MPEILAIAPYPFLSADTRYRVAQFGPLLENAGWHLTLSPFMDERLFKIYNKPGKTIEKVALTFLGMSRRMANILQARKFDVIWLHKEAFPFGPPFLEHFLKSLTTRLVYDLDDAFWTHPPQFNQIGKSFRDPNRIAKMIALSNHVLAGNDFLASYARQYNSEVTIFPTVLDTNRYHVRDEIPDEVITIGWVGRWSSASYLQRLFPVMARLCSENPKIRFAFVGAADLNLPERIPIEIRPWKIEEEIVAIARFDIGIMPLSDDEYSRGKCGFKLLQYMALGIPSVASPIGVNCKIIQNGVNGFLAASMDEWYDRLSTLANNYPLRKKIGYEARITVEKEYNLNHAAIKLVEILKSLV